MKVTGWTKYRPDEIYSPRLCLEAVPDDEDLYEEAVKAIIDELRKRGIRFSGQFHQEGPCGVPILDDKYFFTTTWRQWGEMVADAIDGEDDYFDWYMQTRDKDVYPQPEWYGKEFWT